MSFDPRDTSAFDFDLLLFLVHLAIMTLDDMGITVNCIVNQ